MAVIDTIENINNSGGSPETSNAYAVPIEIHDPPAYIEATKELVSNLVSFPLLLESEADMIFHVANVQASGWSYQQMTVTRLTAYMNVTNSPDLSKFCTIRYRAKKYVYTAPLTRTWTGGWKWKFLLLSNQTDSIIEYSHTTRQNYTSYNSDSRDPITTGYNTYNPGNSTGRLSYSELTGIRNNTDVFTNDKIAIDKLLANTELYYYYPDSGSWWDTRFCLSSPSTFQTSSSSTETYQYYDLIKPIGPIFDIQNVEGILKFFGTGEIIDPVDPDDPSPEVPEVPEGYTITEYTTNWTAWLGKGDGNGKLTIKWYNETAEGLDETDANRVKIDIESPFNKMKSPLYKGTYPNRLTTVMLSEIANSLTENQQSTWRDSNGNPTGKHQIASMLYTTAGNSIVPILFFEFDSSQPFGVRINPDEFIWGVPTTEGAWGGVAGTHATVDPEYIQFTAESGDTFRLYLHDYDPDEDDDNPEDDGYDPDDGDPYDPTDDYGDPDIPDVSLATGVRTYQLNAPFVTYIFNEITNPIHTIETSIFGDALNCVKTLTYCDLPLEFPEVTATDTVTVGLINVQISVASANLLNAPLGSNAVTSAFDPFTIERHWNNFLDFAPYTTIYLHLPYYGFVTLSPSEVYGKELSVKYMVNVSTGESTVHLLVDGCVKYSYSCNTCGIVPMDKVNEAKLLSNGIRETGGLAAGLTASYFMKNPAMAVQSITSFAQNAFKADYSEVNDGKYNGWLNMARPKSIFYIVDTCRAQISNGVAHTWGRPCGLYKYLGGMKGMTVCENVDISGFNCTAEEREELKRIMESGFYL